MKVIRETHTDRVFPSAYEGFDSLLKTETVFLTTANHTCIHVKCIKFYMIHNPNFLYHLLIEKDMPHTISGSKNILQTNLNSKGYDIEM